MTAPTTEAGKAEALERLRRELMAAFYRTGKNDCREGRCAHEYCECEYHANVALSALPPWLAWAASHPDEIQRLAEGTIEDRIRRVATKLQSSVFPGHTATKVAEELLRAGFPEFFSGDKEPSPQWRDAVTRWQTARRALLAHQLKFEDKGKAREVVPNPEHHRLWQALAAAEIALDALSAAPPTPPVEVEG